MNIMSIMNIKIYEIIAEIDRKWLEKAKHGWNMPWFELCLALFPSYLAVVI